MPNGNDIMAWMDFAMTDAGHPKLIRNGGILRFGDDLRWDANTDAKGQWYAHYVCGIPEHQYEPLRPFWSRHVKLYTQRGPD